MIQEQELYYIRGSQASPVTLTASYVASSTVLARHKRNMRIEGTYTPAATNSVLHVLVEFSNDPLDTVTPTHWRPLDVQVAATTEIDLYADGGTGMSTRAGIPIIIPGDKTSSIAEVIDWDWSNSESLSVNWIRVSFKEVTTGEFGTTDCEISLSTN